MPAGVRQTRRLLVFGVGNLQMPTTKHSIGQNSTVGLSAKTKLHPGAKMLTGAGPDGQLLLNKKTDCLSSSFAWPTGSSQPKVEVHFAVTRHLMNLSGLGLQAYLRSLNEKVADCSIIVVHDDITVKPNEVIVKKGRLGAKELRHGGLKSVNELVLRGQPVTRFAIGIGEPPTGRKDLASHVLSPLTRDEQLACSFDERTGGGSVLIASWIALRRELDRLLGVGLGSKP